MAKLISFTEDFECITVFSLLLGNGKHFPFHHFRRTEVIPLDYTGYRNFHRHNSAVVFATTFKRKPNRVHNQLLIINNSKWKSITFGCIGEWLSIFLWLGYANQYQSIGFCCFLLIIYNGNWTEWSAIWSEIIRVISKSNERAARVRFEITSMISDQNCTTRSSITTLLLPFWNRRI